MFQSSRGFKTMKIFLCLLLIGIVAVNCLPKRGKHGGGGRRGGGGRGGDEGRGGGRGRGPPGERPCETQENLESCTCKDGEVYTNKEDLMTNCKKTGDNPILACACEDGTTWSPKPKPCGSRDNIEECTCEDGETYSDPKEIRRNCKRRGPTSNPIESCTCNDGTTFTPPEKGSEEEPAENESEEESGEDFGASGED